MKRLSLMQNPPENSGFRGRGRGRGAIRGRGSTGGAGRGGFARGGFARGASTSTTFSNPSGRQVDESVNFCHSVA